MALDKIDVSALRHADYVVFAFNRNRDPKYTVRACKDENERAPFGAQRNITIDGHVVAHDGMIVGSAVCSLRSYEDEWRTVASLLRVGDELMVTFVGANNSDTLRAANLFADELRLHVLRGNDSRKTMTFLLDYRVCPDNTARMVQR